MLALTISSIEFELHTPFAYFVLFVSYHQNSINDHNNIFINLKRLASLWLLDWSFNKQTNRVAQSLMTHFLSELNSKTPTIGMEPTDMTPIINFFFKMYEFDSPPAQITTLILETLSEKHTALRISFGINLTKNILTDLLAYLTSNNQEVQRGCAIIINLMMDYISRFSSSSIRKDAYNIEQYKIPIEKFLIQRMLNSEDILTKSAGINLIILDNSNAYHIPSMLEEQIMDCQSNMEAKAWGRVIRYANLGDKGNQIKEWKNFLERVLEKKPKALSAIHDASFSKYEMLVVLQEYENFLDEDKLGLPFNREE